MGKVGKLVIHSIDVRDRLTDTFPHTYKNQDQLQIKIKKTFIDIIIHTH